MTLRRHQTPNPEQVIATLENSGLDKASTLIIGGGVLAILGIRPATDVDVIIPRMLHDELLRNNTTSTGLHVARKPGSQHNFLHTPPTKNQYLRLDIGPAYAPQDPDRMVDDEFLELIKIFPHYSGYAHLPIESVLAHKRDTSHKGRRHDIHLIENYLKHQRV